MSDIKDSVKKILEIVSSLKRIDNIGGNELSEKALLLSIHKVYVGQKLVQLEYELDHNKMIRKTEWGGAFLATEGTVDAKKIAADEKVREMVGEEIELERKIGILKNLRVDVSDLTTVIQTRISQLKSELMESR